MRICLLGVGFDTRNLGVSALAHGTIVSILSKFPTAQISLLEYSKQRTILPFTCSDRTIPIELVNIRFSKHLYAPNHIVVLVLLALLLKVIPSAALRNFIVSHNHSLNHLASVNLVASMAGGDSFTDVFGLRRFIYIVLPQILVLLLRKPLILLPQTLGPFQSRLARIVAKSVLSRAALIYSRDHTGREQVCALLKSCRHADRLRFCFDVGFAVEPVRPHKLLVDDWLHKRSRVPLVGVNVSGLLFEDKLPQTQLKGVALRYRELVSATIDLLVTEKNATVLLIPHVYAPGEDDFLAAERVYATASGKYGDRVFILRGSYNQTEIRYIIGMCDFVVGARMHVCIAALAQHVPAVATAYSHKFRAVMETLSMAEWVADVRTMDNETILLLIGRAYERRHEIRKQLLDKIPTVKQSVHRLFYEIDRDVRGGDVLKDDTVAVTTDAPF